MKLLLRAWFVLFVLSLVTPVNAQNNENVKKEILRAITEGSNYACDVLLDKEGKSRCDYNWVEGKWYPYEEPWHTGQIIFALVDAYKLTGNGKFLDNAKRAGNWWVGLEVKEDTKLKGMVKAIHGDGREHIVFATISDGSNGLFNLWRLTKEDKYASVPTAAGDWMMNNMYIPAERIFYDDIDPVTGVVLKENASYWPDKKERKLYEVARPNNEGYLFKDMYEYTGNEKYKKMFIELCESLVEKQGVHGVWMDFMPNNAAEGSIHPRFPLWYAESLIEGYELTGNKKYLDAAVKTARVFAKLQQKDGTIYYTNYTDGKKNQNSICGSATSFAGIIWLRLIKAGVGDEFKENVERSLSFVLNNRFDVNHPDKNLAGGFLETRVRSKNGQIWFTARQDIAASFGIRFLCDYYKYNFGGK